MESRLIEKFAYHVGLSRLDEAVISSHFMDAIARDSTLQFYDDGTLNERAIVISQATVDHRLVPILVSSARAFAKERASAASNRAKQHFQAYGLTGPGEVTEAETITELFFDRQLSRKSSVNCSRQMVRDQILGRLSDDRVIELVIPALPFKILSPLKARGALPDLAEVGFLLSLYEIALAVETVSSNANSGAKTLSSRFVVVSDGSRFASLANVPGMTIIRYRRALESWIGRLGIHDHVILQDYRELLGQRLPEHMLTEKRRIADMARELYADVLDPVFDPCSMEQSLAMSRAIEPDPESENADGRFASLLRSLIYTINYRALEAAEIPSVARLALYRELTSSLFEPQDDTALVPGTLVRKEVIRRAMLKEAWQAAIEYMAEIKSDRDMAQDPISVCLPDAVRWTIHAKAGQFAIVTPSIERAMVQAWAGSGVFKRTSRGAMRLGSYPALGLEGHGAIPVLVSSDDVLERQPLFYIDPKLDIADAETLVARLTRSLTRRRLQ